MKYIKLKDAFSIKKGKKVEVIDDINENTIRCIQIGDLRNNENLKYCLPSDKHVIVNENDILIAWDGANAGTVGVGLKGALGSTLAKLELKAKELNPYFVALLLQSKFDYFQRTATGATIPHISRKALEEISLPILPLEEQNKIVTIIKAVKSIIEKRQSQIAALDELVQSVFLDMFGNPILNTRGLPIKSLNQYIAFLTSGSRGWAKYFADEGQYFITIKNVKNGKLVFKNTTFINPPDTQEAIRTKVKENDLLISITADLGRTAVVDKETAFHGGYINQHLSLIRLNDEVNPFYLSAFLESWGGKTQFEKLNQNGVKAGLNFDSIKSLKIMLPPIKEQNNFADKLRMIEVQKQLLHKALIEMQFLYNSLLQKAFQGEFFQEK